MTNKREELFLEVMARDEDIESLRLFVKELRLTQPGIGSLGPFTSQHTGTTSFYLNRRIGGRIMLLTCSLRLTYKNGHWSLENMTGAGAFTHPTDIEHFDDEVDLESRVKELLR